MRTSGPLRPSGRKSASTTIGGSVAGNTSSRRSSVAAAMAKREASCSSAPGNGSWTKSTSRSLPRPNSRPPKRPMAITANRVSGGPFVRLPRTASTIVRIPASATLVKAGPLASAPTSPKTLCGTDAEQLTSPDGADRRGRRPPSS